MPEYDFETDLVVEQIKKAKAKRVGLQFPEGLKDKAVEIASLIEGKTKAKVFIYVDPTYGACDLKKNQYRDLKLDLLVHFGHTGFL
ncbi:MAG: diphthamide synthesis protein [Candidatus Altiarchaeota archaeon]|nr:diphthamide synthesis protein [Candidatus Altiarchaeota archaeon]